MKKYFMVTRDLSTGRESEEELTSIYVTEDSPHFETHEAGYHDLCSIKGVLSEEEVKHYAKNIVDNFNRTLRPMESPRELVSWRVE